MRNRPLLARIFPPAAARPPLPNPSPAAGNLSDPAPVIALHGTLDSPGAWAPSADGLHSLGRRVHIPAYGNRSTAVLADSVAEVEAYVNGICTETNSDTVDIVAHSQGGLLVFLLFTRLAGHDGERTSFRRVISVSGSVDGVNLTGISRTLGWWNRAPARWPVGQTLADQIAAAAGKYKLPAANTAPHLRGRKASAPDWTNVISRHDSLVTPWSGTAQSFLPDSRTVLLESELEGRSVAHRKQQTGPEVIGLITHLLA